MRFVRRPQGKWGEKGGILISLLLRLRGKKRGENFARGKGRKGGNSFHSPWEISPAEKPRLDGKGVGGREGGRKKKERVRSLLA